MILTIPDEYIKQTNISTDKLKFEFACFLYQQKIFTIGQAANFCEIDLVSFQKELSKRNISIHYEISDLEVDLRNLKTL